MAPASSHSAGGTQTAIELEYTNSHRADDSKKLFAPSATHDLGIMPSFNSRDQVVSLGVPGALEAGPQRWNNPRGNILRTLCTFWAFVTLGVNDAAYGALIPYLEEYYNITYTVVALVFLSPLVGYFVASLTNNAIHDRFGQRGIAIIAPICKIICYVVVAVHPPFPTLVVTYLIAGYGAGLEDAAWNAFVGAMENPNELLGFLHGFYGLGATLGPLIATSMVTKGRLPWYYFYYILVRVSSPLSVLIADSCRRLLVASLSFRLLSMRFGIAQEQSIAVKTQNRTSLVTAGSRKPS